MTAQFIPTAKPRFETIDEFLSFVQCLTDDWQPLFMCGFETSTARVPILVELDPAFFKNDAAKDQLVVETCFIAAQESPTYIAYATSAWVTEVGATQGRASRHEVLQVLVGQRASDGTLGETRVAFAEITGGPGLPPVGTWSVMDAGVIGAGRLAVALDLAFVAAKQYPGFVATTSDGLSADERDSVFKAAIAGRLARMTKSVGEERVA